jgi:hypothetical protein
VVVVVVLAFVADSGSALMPMAPCAKGRITYYDYTADGSCGFGPLTSGTYGAAPNEAFYSGAQLW